MGAVWRFPQYLSVLRVMTMGLSNFVGLFCCVHARAGRQTNRHIESHILVVFTGNFTGQPVPKRAYFVTLDYTTFLSFFQEKFIHKPGGKILDFSRFFQCTMHSSQCTMDVSTSSTYYKFLYHRGAIPQLCILHCALTAEYKNFPAVKTAGKGYFEITPEQR